MKYVSFCLMALTWCMVGESKATTISLSDFSGSGATFVENTILTSSGAALPVGGALVRVGFFTDLSSQVTSALQSSDRTTVYDALSTYFVGLGEGGDSDLGIPQSGGPRIVTRTVNGLSQDGRLFGNITGVNPGTYNPPANISGVPTGTQLYVVVYDKASAETSGELAIFSSDDASWKMPADPLVNLTLNTVLVDTPAEILRGSQGSIRLAPIPEPSASLLTLGAFSILFRRRR